MIDIGSRRQLFIDDRFIESRSGVTLTMNPPVQHAEPVLTPDKPWEELGIGAYNTVWREPDGTFRLWYDALLKGGLPHEGARRLAYAESDDGIHWRKPELGLVSFRGSTRNNLLVPHDERQSLQGATVFRDDRAPAEERYKFWTKFRPTDAEIAAGAAEGLWAMRSPDGIHWQPYPDQPNPREAICDTQNMLFWDERLGLYVGYIRVKETQRLSEAAVAAGRGSYRSVGRITSPDFREWSPLTITFQADAQDLAIPVPWQRDNPRPNIDIYTSCAMPYPWAQDVYVMLPSIYYHWGENEFPATMDVQLLTSRDGVRWNRAGGRKAFLRHGFDGSSTSGMLFANPWLIPVGDELWLYYSGMKRRHDPGKDPATERELSRLCHLSRATLRRDGFISADADYGGGELLTPVVRFTGRTLVVNCDAGAGGWMKIEMLDREGHPLPGFGMDAADAVLGNGVSKTVTWQGSSDVSAAAGTPVRLRFLMRDVKLYAFQFPEADD